MKLGVNLWTVYGWNIYEPVSADMIRAVADMGGAAVELVMDEQDNTAATLLDRYDELHAVQESLGIAIPSIAAVLSARPVYTGERRFGCWFLPVAEDRPLATRPRRSSGRWGNRAFPPTPR